MAYHEGKFAAVLESIEDTGFVVFGPRILILRDDADDMVGSLHVPDAAKKNKKTGTIVALGQGYARACEEEYVEGVVVGQRVMFNAYDGVEGVLDTHEYGKQPVLFMHVGQMYGGFNNKEAI